MTCMANRPQSANPPKKFASVKVPILYDHLLPCIPILHKAATLVCPSARANRRYSRHPDSKETPKGYPFPQSAASEYVPGYSFHKKTLAFPCLTYLRYVQALFRNIQPTHVQALQTAGRRSIFHGQLPVPFQRSIIKGIKGRLQTILHLGIFVP